MLGVVLWSDARDRKAVIWCEDQGDLAYMSGSDAVLNSEDFFDAGDLVQFDMCMDKSTRRARNPRLVMEKANPALPGVLQKEAKNETNSPHVARNVIPFPCCLPPASEAFA